jgi:hypothetical protein
VSPWLVCCWSGWLSETNTTIKAQEAKETKERMKEEEASDPE